MINNSATLDGTLFTLHASQVPIDMPTLSEKDKEVCSPSVDPSVSMNSILMIVLFIWLHLSFS